MAHLAGQWSWRDGSHGGVVTRTGTRVVGTGAATQARFGDDSRALATCGELDTHRALRGRHVGIGAVHSAGPGTGGKGLAHCATVLPCLGAIAVLPIAVLPIAALPTTVSPTNVLPTNVSPTNVSPTNVSPTNVSPTNKGQGRGVLRYCGLSQISTSFVLLWWADLPHAWAVSDLQDLWIYVQRSFVAFASVDVGSKLMTIGAWIAVVVRLLQFAARPHSTDQRAPIGLRKAAVFAAEFAIALLCAATYYHFSDLFAGILIDWWPIVLIAVAMLSAGVGEWLRRVGEPILADPVQQSSLLLPIIPLAGVWVFRAETAQLQWDQWGRYTLLLLSGAGLYGLHGWARKSVALLGMVWYARQAIGQVWPWWAFGIATGIGLIVCLGYFKKNRPRVIAYLEHFRQWEN